MKKVYSIFIGLFVFLGLVVLASCGGNSCGIKGFINKITENKNSFVVECDFDANDKLSSKEAKPFVVAVDGEGKEVDNVSIGFSDKIVTKGTATISGLSENTEYTVKLCVTIEGYVYDLDERTAKTITVEEENSEANPFKITTVDEFKNMKADADLFYRLDADLDFDGAIANVFPISNKFKGSFDGNNHTIKNFKTTNGTYSGLFGYVEGGSIKNLKVSDVTIEMKRGDVYLGAVIGYAKGATITNVTADKINITFTANTTTPKDCVGAFAGILYNCTVTDCGVSNSKVKIGEAKLNGSFGGFVGAVSDQTEMKNCYSKADLEVNVCYNDADVCKDSYTYVGGFAGLDNSGSAKSIEDSYVVSNIVIKEISRSRDLGLAKSHKVSVGGFIGSNGDSYVNIKNCFAKADIDATLLFPTNGYIGGFAGEITDTNCLHRVKMKNCAYLEIENGIKITPNDFENCNGDNLKGSMFIGNVNFTEDATYKATTAITNCFSTIDLITPDTITISPYINSSDFSEFSDAIRNNEDIKAIINELK